MNPFADQIHADRCTDRGDIIGAQRSNNRLQRRDHVVPRYDHFIMIAPYVFRHLARILEVDRIQVHANREGPQRLVHELRRYAAYQRRVKAAREKESNRCVSVQSLLDSRNKLVMDISLDLRQFVLQIISGVPDPAVFRHSNPLVLKRNAFDVPGPQMRSTDHSEMSGREWLDPLADSDQAFGLRCKYRYAFLIPAKIQRPDPDRIPRRDVLFSICIVQNQGKLRIQEAEHVDSILLIKGQQDFTVRVAHERVTFFDQPFLHLAKPIKLTVADYGVSV